MIVADSDALKAAAAPESPLDRRAWVAAHLVIASVGGLLLAYTGYRAHALSFTHDESLSYLFHVSRSYGSILLDADTANNHLLNTVLMKLFGAGFGPHPLWLRLPNLAAHAVYLVFSCLWLRLFARPGVLVAGFLVLNLNPYLLDFFSLARGYGLSTGLMMASVYFMTRTLRSGDLQNLRNLRMEAASLVSAALAVLASYTLLNVYLALLIVLNVAAVGRYRSSRSDEPIAAFLFRRNLPAGIVSSLLAGLLFAPLIQLAAGGQLYYGGTQGFWRDTLASLIDRTLYQPSHAGEAAHALVLSFVVLIATASVLSIAKQLRSQLAETLVSPLFASCLLLLLAALSTVVQHHWLGTPYLMGRTALFLVPLFWLMAICLWTTVRADRPRRLAGVLAGGTALVSLVHLLASINGSSALDWRYDATTRQVVDYLEQQQASSATPTAVGVNWRFAPTMFFYRETRELPWLQIVENADTHHSELDRRGFGSRMHYYYVLDEDLASIDHDYRPELRFAETEVGSGALYRSSSSSPD
ncbi:MAG: hypothetical protein VX681_07175 [Myxococcota bacterium]|nr:hypothetical protein [Myxococcota bacterium]